MSEIFNTPSMSYLVDASSPGKGHLMYFRIDQAIPVPGDKAAENRVYSQVQSHLSDLGRRTGLAYELVYWSRPERFNEYLRVENIELS